MRKKTTLSTIAKLAGVSKQVVFTVLNNREGTSIRVGPKTRERILEISRRLGYVIPKGARELFSGRSNNIGVIFHKVTPPFSRRLSHLQQEARQRNLEITPYITDMKPELEEYYLNSARDGRVDGLIITGGIAGSIERYQRFAKPPYNLKIVLYGEPIPGVATVHFDETAAGRLAAEHLAEIGCRKPAFFGESKKMARAKGFIQYFRERKLPPPLVVVDKDWTWCFAPEGKVLAQELLKLKDLPDGIFSHNDLLASALLSGALRNGLRVPDDLAIMGCDNSEICLYTTPTLTSIETGFPVVVTEMLNKIEAMIKGEEPRPLHTEAAVSLVARESTERRGKDNTQCRN